MSKKVLLTGASGFIGKFCYDLLLLQGYEVFAVCNKNPTNKNYSKIDLLDDKSRHLFLEQIKPDYLLHLAWDVAPGYRNSDNNLSWFNASIDMLQQFYKLGGKFALTVGSCFEYNLHYTYDGICMEHMTPLNPDTIYGQCKKHMFEYMRLWAEQYNYKYAHARVFYLYGPYEFDNRFVPSVLTNLLQNKLVNLSSGKQIRDFLYVKDVASAIVSILNAEIYGLSINIGSGVGVSLKEIAATSAELLHVDQNLLNFGVRPDGNEPPIIIADTYLLNKIIGWKPKFTLEEGLSQTIEYWREQQNGN